MRTYKPDANQKPIIAALRNTGATVCSLAAVGSGCPDLLVGWNGENILVEIKNPDGRGMRFTPAELAFVDTWRGRVYVVIDIIQALAVLDAKAD